MSREESTREDDALTAVIDHAIGENISIMGNCLGTTADLTKAVDDYSRRRLKVKIDSIFKPDQMAAFFRRTFDTSDRFGKVAMLYESQ
jgi:D-arabinose 1-dehydrogenase-like Zn-dependent alcohol dehydrogenase